MDNDKPEECKVCFDNFDEALRRPRSLPCGHTFCTVCIVDMIKNSQFTCPNCCADHNTLAVTDVTQLPINYGMESFIRRLKGVSFKPAQTKAPTKPPQDGPRGISKKLRSLLQEEMNKVISLITACDEKLSQLGKYGKKVKDLKTGHNLLEDRLNGLLEQNKAAKELVEQEETSVEDMSTEGEEEKQQLQAVLEYLDTVNSAQEVGMAIEDSDRRSVVTEDWIHKCQEQFPNVNTVHTSVKVQESIRLALDTIPTEAVATAAPLHLGDSASTILEKFDEITTIKLTLVQRAATKMGRPKISNTQLRQGNDKVFGVRMPLPSNKLPLNKEVGSALAYEAENERLRRRTNAFDYMDATNKVTEKVLDVYRKATVPTISEIRVKMRVHDLWRMRRETMMMKGNGQKQKRKKTKNGKLKMRFEDIAEKLFDVADDSKVHEREKSFLAAQRKPGREGCIDGVDKIVTAKLKEEREKEAKRAKKRAEEERKTEKMRSKSKEEMERMSCKVSAVDDSAQEEDSDYKDVNDNEFKAMVDRRARSEKRKREKEAEDRIGETADRFKVSNDAVAHIANTIRAADNIITEGDKSKVTNWKKVERVRKRSREQKKEKFRGFKVRGLMVDERINENKIVTGVGEKNHKRFAMEKREDCAVIGFPGEEFLGHLVPVGGKGVDLATSLLAFLEERGIDTTDLLVVLSDGCNKLSGYNHGFIAEFERLLGRPLLHIHCLIHSLEKLFGHLFNHYAGPTTGPASWSGEEARKLTGNVWDLPVVEFEAVTNTYLRSLLDAIPSVVWEEFSWDTRYLLEMAKTVESGHIEERWARARAGAMTNARWQNTESRELRAYMSTTSPSESQRRMTSFIILIYVPSFLEIRQRNLLLEGPCHLLAIINRVRTYCTLEEVELLTPYLQFNGYFGQHEVVLVSLLASMDKSERELALNIIKQLRKKEKRHKRKTVRKVRNPQLNLAATKLSELVDLQKASSSPPILFQHSDQELEQFLEEPYSEPGLPCTTTAVERGVKLTTEAADVASSAWQQDQVTWNKLEARKRNKRRAKKEDYQC